LINPVAAGQAVRWSDVVVDETSSAVKIRREVEQRFACTPELAPA